jgi:hypothetical protein
MGLKKMLSLPLLRGLFSPMIVEISLILGAILLSVAIHYVMQHRPVNLNGIIRDMQAMRRKIEVLENNLTLAINNTQEWVRELMPKRSLEGRTKREVDLTKRVEELAGQVDDCQSDLRLLEKRINHSNNFCTKRKFLFEGRQRPIL